MAKSQNRPRLSDRSHELASRIDPDGNQARTIEYALELAALIEWRGENPEIGQGPQTKHASAVLRAYLEGRRDHALLRLAQGLEVFAMASASTWPDGSVGLRGLAEWLSTPEADANPLGSLSRGDDMLAILRRAHGIEADE